MASTDRSLTGAFRTTTALLAAGLALPLAGLVLLLAAPSLDVRWAHHPSHFWLVLLAAAASGALAYSMASGAARRGDARVLLVSLAFLAAAGFLGLHALATPGVLLEEQNTGFFIATPVGLLLAAGGAAISSAELPAERARRLVARAGRIRGALLIVIAVWAVLSLLSLPPLHGSAEVERLSGPLVGIAIVALVLYGIAAGGYLRLLSRRRSRLLAAMFAAFILLAEAMVAAAVSRTWHATWWEWHLLMLAAFGVVAWAAHAEWHEERYGDLYGQATAGKREVSVLFADLAGFTAFAEPREPDEVTAMLNTYFEATIPPVVERHEGHVDRLVGDAVLVTFNAVAAQPDHPERAARAALEIQQAAARVSESRPDWPRFRVGVNTGEASVGVLGAGGGRSFTVIGDAVNVAARVEAEAPVGAVAVTSETSRHLPGADLEPLGNLQVKGRQQQVQAFVLRGLGPSR